MLLMLAGAGLAAHAAKSGLLPLASHCAGVLGALGAANLIAAPLLYGWDKWLAVAGQNRQRIPELALHMVSLVGGAIGAFVSARLFRHKIHKRSFQRRFWLTSLVSLGLYGVGLQLCC